MRCPLHAIAHSSRPLHEDSPYLPPASRYRIIGQVSMRQVRVFKNSCKVPLTNTFSPYYLTLVRCVDSPHTPPTSSLQIPVAMQSLNMSCYAEYSADTEDKSPIKPSQSHEIPFDITNVTHNSDSSNNFDSSNSTAAATPDEAAGSEARVLSAVHQG